MKNEPKPLVCHDTTRLSASEIQEMLAEMEAARENDERPTVPSLPPLPMPDSEEVVPPPNPPAKV